MEIEVGENRSGVIEENAFRILLESIKASKNVEFKGVFSHDGHSYKAENLDECREIFTRSVERTLRFQRLQRKWV